MEFTLLLEKRFIKVSCKFEMLITEKPLVIKHQPSNLYGTHLGPIWAWGTHMGTATWLYMCPIWAGP